MKKTYKRITILVILLILLIFYLLNSSLVIKSILEYTNLFLTKLFPVSFLFMIFSSLLLDYGIIELLTNYLHLNGSKIYILLMSLISGFPSGSIYTKELLNKNIIDKETANKYITFTHFPNPLFILGSVATIINSNKLTIFILISIIMSNILLSFVYKSPKTSIQTEQNTKEINFSKSLSKAITTSLKTLIVIYGTSVFFYLISVIINNYLTLPVLPYIILNGFFDLTKGVFSTTLITNTLTKCYLIIIFISMGGLSINMQVKSIISNSNIKYKNFLKGRVISTILSLIIFYILITISYN